MKIPQMIFLKSRMEYITLTEVVEIYFKPVNILLVRHYYTKVNWQKIAWTLGYEHSNSVAIPPENCP